MRVTRLPIFVFALSGVLAGCSQKVHSVSPDASVKSDAQVHVFGSSACGDKGWPHTFESPRPASRS